MLCNNHHTAHANGPSGTLRLHIVYFKHSGLGWLHAPRSSSRCKAAAADTPLPSNSSSSIARRGLLLTSLISFPGAQLLAPAPSDAAITVTIRSKPQLKEFNLAGGYSISVPNTWALAYDRSGAAELGVQVLFGNFRTFETLSIAKLSLDQAGLSAAAAQGPGWFSSDLQQVAELLVAEHRDNASTMSFTLLDGQQPAAATSSNPGSSDSTPSDINAAASSSSSGLQGLDAEFVVKVCRGQIQEGLKGSKRCVGLNDTDLQTITRHYLATITRSGPFVYIIKGSATTERWPAVAADMTAALASFTPPPSSA